MWVSAFSQCLMSFGINSVAMSVLETVSNVISKLLDVLVNVVQ